MEISAIIKAIGIGFFIIEGLYCLFFPTAVKKRVPNLVIRFLGVQIVIYGVIIILLGQAVSGLVTLIDVLGE